MKKKSLKRKMKKKPVNRVERNGTELGIRCDNKTNRKITSENIR